MSYPDSVIAQLTGPTVRIAVLARFDFRSGPMRLWTGTGSIDVAAPAGTQVERWRGLGELATLSGIAQAADGLAAEELELTLSAADAALTANFASDATETDGRSVTFYEAFFGDDGAPLVAPMQIFTGTMGPPTVSRDPVQGDEPPRRVITVRAVNLFAERRRPVLTFFSDRDQRARSDDDAIFSRVGNYAGGSVEVRWPVGGAFA